MHVRVLSARTIACVCLVLSGCHLVDQRDFNANAGRPPAPRPPSPAAPPPPALVRIRYTVPEPQYRDAVAALVQRALARKRDVLFVVTTVVPTLTGAAAAADSGREVAQAIVDDGAEAGQVEQTVQVDPAIGVKEVRIDVR